MDTQKPNDRLGLKTHISYGVSQFGICCIQTAFGINALFFYTTILKFDSALFGTILLVGRLWDGVSDPLMGYLSDNTKWRRGRRRPFLVPGGILYGIAFFLIFSPPRLHSSATMFAYLLVLILLMFTGRTVLETPYLALAPELTPDYSERTKLSGFKQVFGTLGDASGAILPLLLLGAFHHERRPAHLLFGLIACGLTIMFAAITRWGTFEKPGLAHKTQIGVAESFKAVARNKPYLIFIFSSTMAQMGNNIVTYLVLFLTKYWFLDEGLATRFFAVFFMGALCGVPVWVRVANWIGKKWAYITIMTGYGLLLTTILIFPRDAINPITVVMFFAGFFMTGLFVLASALAPDIIEWDEFHTGKRREGVFSGVWTFSFKCGIGFAIMFVGFALKIINFDAELAVQTDSTLLGLRILFGLISALFLFAGALAFLAYPISKRRHEEIRRLIRERSETENPEIDIQN